MQISKIGFRYICTTICDPKELTREEEVGLVIKETQININKYIPTIPSRVRVTNNIKGGSYENNGFTREADSLIWNLKNLQERRDNNIPGEDSICLITSIIARGQHRRYLEGHFCRQTPHTSTSSMGKNSCSPFLAAWWVFKIDCYIVLEFRRILVHSHTFYILCNTVHILQHDRV